MADFTWARNFAQGQSYSSGNKLLASVPRGSTLYRVRFGWGFAGFTSQTANIGTTLQNVQLFGIVTTVGDGSESPPNAYAGASNENPPSERWLWWEMRAPRIRTYSDSADAVWYDDSGPQEAVDARAMVSAKEIAAGDSLNVWASWQSEDSGWDASGLAWLWVWASIGWK